MIFAPYRSVLDLADDVNGSDARQRRQLAWDEIDYELSGIRVERVRSLGRWVHARISEIRLATQFSRAGERKRLGAPERGTPGVRS